MSSVSSLVRWLLSILWAVFTKLFSRRCSIADEACARESACESVQHPKASAHEPPDAQVDEGKTGDLDELPVEPWHEAPADTAGDARSDVVASAAPPVLQPT